LSEEQMRENLEKIDMLFNCRENFN
jgi:hypothetical protein